MTKIVYVFEGDINLPKGTSIRAKKMLLHLAKDNKILLLARKSFPKTKNIKFLKLKGSTLSAFKANKEAIRKFKPEIVYSQARTGLSLGILISKYFKIKHVNDVHSFIYHDLIYLRRNNPYTLKNLFLILSEKIQFRFVNGFTLTNSGLIPNLPKRKSLVINGGVDKSFLTNKKIDSEMKKIRAKNKNKIIVTYAGNFFSYQGVYYLFEATKKLLKENFLFVFVGNPDTLRDDEMYQKLSLQKNVKFLGLVKPERIPSILAGSDILIVPRTTDKINYNAFPTKLIEYLGSRKAVIATDVGDLSNVVINNKTGLLIKPNSTKAIINALLKLKDKKLRSKLADGGYEFVKKELVWPKLCKDLKRFFGEFLA